VSRGWDPRRGHGHDCGCRRAGSVSRRHRGSWRGHLQGAARPGRPHGGLNPTAYEQRHVHRQISVQAIGQRFSACTSAVSTPDAGLRGALSRLRAHQSPTLASAFAVAGGRSAASASAIRTPGSVQRRRYVPLVTAGWHGHDNPGPVVTSLGLCPHLRSQRKLLIVLKPLARSPAPPAVPSPSRARRRSGSRGRPEDRCLSS
jgi:hypothetical protein